MSEARTSNTLYTIYTLLGQHSQAQHYLEKHLTIQAQICAANPSNPTAFMDCLEEGNMFGIQHGVDFSCLVRRHVQNLTSNTKPARRLYIKYD